MSATNATPLRLDCDVDAAAHALQRLAALVSENGGSFSDRLFVRARGGDLALASDGPNDRQAQLLHVPFQLMPDCKSFDVRLEQGRFVAEAKRDAQPVTDLHRKAMDGMLAVYNALDKSQQWARTSPWLTLWHDPDVLHKLVHAEPGKAGSPPQLTAYRAGDWNSTLIASFLKSRTFNLRPQQDPDRAEQAEVLMPFIDFLNHHFLARGYQIAPGPGGGLFTFHDRPVSGANECFVRYNMMDIHNALAGYGFLDDSAPFAISQAGKLKLTDGLKLTVHRQPLKGYKGQLPHGVRDLGIHMPQVGNADDNTIVASRLLVPASNAPRALRRVLGALVAQKRPDWSRDKVQGAVLAAERQLLELNHRYYDELADTVAEARQRSEDDDPPGRKASLRAVDALVRRQKRHLYAYMDRLEGA